MPFFIIIGLFLGLVAMLAGIAAGLGRGARDGLDGAWFAFTGRRCQHWAGGDDGVYWRCGATLPFGRRCRRANWSVIDHRPELPAGATAGDGWLYADEAPHGAAAGVRAVAKTLAAGVGLALFVAFLLLVYVIGPLQGREATG